MELAHFETVNDVLETITFEQLEKVKAKMVRSLIEKKVLQSYLGTYLVVVDATGATSYDQKVDNSLLTRTSSTGKTTFYNMVLEAKIVTPEGLAISIASVPLSNEELEEYIKQDWELKAFKRLVVKIKKLSPGCLFVL